MPKKDLTQYFKHKDNETLSYIFTKLDYLNCPKYFHVSAALTRCHTLAIRLLPHADSLI